MYLVLEVAVDEVGPANNRDSRSQGKQQNKSQHADSQSPPQKVTPLWKPSALAIGFKAVLVASGSGLKTGKRPPEQFQPIVMAVD